MHLRCCCVCGDDGQKENNESRVATATSSPTSTEVVSEQPKTEQRTYLDKPSGIPNEVSKVETVHNPKDSFPDSISTDPASSIQLTHITKETNKEPVPTQLTPSSQNGNTVKKNSAQNDYVELYYVELLKHFERLKTLDRNTVYGEKAYQETQQKIMEVQMNFSVSEINNHSNTNNNFFIQVGEEQLKFVEVGKGRYMGYFKGCQFVLFNGQFIGSNYSYSERDKEAILTAFHTIISRTCMEESKNSLEAGTGTSKMSTKNHTISSASPLNVTYVEKKGKPGEMTFLPGKPGHYKGTFRDIEFSIVNGELNTKSGSIDGLDKEIILNSYKMGLLGLKNSLLGMQQGKLGSQAASKGFNAELMQTNTSFDNVSSKNQAVSLDHPKDPGMKYTTNGTQQTQLGHETLFEGQETLQRIRSLNQRKRISVLQGGLIAQPRQSSIMKENTAESSKKLRVSDEVDGELVLRKTTFTPKEVIYEDPKTYEKLDHLELSYAKRLDEYIISLDPNFNLENRYHFHIAKPKRVVRKKINPKDQLAVASPDRYTLFINETLKLHNKYRKKHGVPPLIHNEFLCEVAKEWAEHLALKDAFYHRPKNEYGENLYYSERIAVRARHAVKAWYDEILLYDYDNPKFSKETGHFTQLIWKDTKEVGTGVAQIGDKMWVCCNYYPPGNVANKFNDEFVPRSTEVRARRDS